MQFFSSFSQHFFLLDSFDFHLDSTRIFQVHDMTINFSFFFTICLLRATMHAIDGPPGWSTTSYERIVLKEVVFWFKVVKIISVQKGLWLKSILEKWAILFNVPQGINQGDFRVSRSWDFVLLIEKVWQVWNCSKSWCIPNYQLSVSFKTHHFFAWFPKNSREFANQESYDQLLEKVWSNGLFDFFKIVPFGAPRFSKDSKVEESVY